MVKVYFFLLLLPLLFLSGCGDPNPEAVYTAHAVGLTWLDSNSPDFHGNAYLENPESCKGCHGSDYNGGSSRVSCSQCHFGPDGSRVPAGENWTHGTIPHANLAAYETTCTSCHTLLRSYNNGPNSCHDCHAGAAPHSVGTDWLLRDGHVAAADTSCLSCHIADGSGSGPSCLSCHSAGDPLVVTDCESCHSQPPSQASTAVADRPNRAGAHAVHTPLTADTSSCSACHDGAGSNTLNHYDTTEPASMQFLATYNATATASYSGSSCSNVSCHGGVTTPNWDTGEIDVYAGGKTACQQCHQSSGEYNAYASGEHGEHLSKSFIACDTCHDLDVLQNGVGGNSHFSGLETRTFELDPQQTVYSGKNSANLDINYNGTGCAPACHGSENWR